MNTMVAFLASHALIQFIGCIVHIYNYPVEAVHTHNIALLYVYFVFSRSFFPKFVTITAIVTTGWWYYVP